MAESKVEYGISTQSLIKIILFGLVIWFLWTIRDILILLLISITLSSALDPLVDFLSTKKIPRAVSVLAVYILAIAFVVFVAYLMVPAFVVQLRQLSETGSIDQLTRRIGLSDTFLGRTISRNLMSLGAQLTDFFSADFFSKTLGVFNGFVEFITILVISFYLTAEPNGMKNFIITFVPEKNQPYITGLVNKIQKKIGWWFIGQFIVSAAIFVLVFVGLSILNVKFALLLALLAGILEFVPYIGPFIFAIPGILFAFAQNPALAIPVAFMYLIIQKLEGYLLVPKIMEKTVGVSPLVIMIAIIIGFNIAGIFGVLLAVPVVAGVNVFIKERGDVSGHHEMEGGEGHGTEEGRGT